MQDSDLQDSHNSRAQNNKTAKTTQNAPKTLTTREVFACSASFALIVVLANYTVQFNIANTYLTYGALVYPLSFLMLDILSEKYGKKTTLKTLRLGVILAFLPSFFIAQPSIAIASVCAFFVSQHLDVYIFFALKRLFPRLWWLRTNLSTILAQFIDTMIFFHIALLVALGWKAMMITALLDFCVKIALSLINTPFFYIFAVRVKKLI